MLKNSFLKAIILIFICSLFVLGTSIVASADDAGIGVTAEINDAELGKIVEDEHQGSNASNSSTSESNNTENDDDGMYILLVIAGIACGEFLYLIDTHIYRHCKKD